MEDSVSLNEAAVLQRRKARETNAKRRGQELEKIKCEGNEAFKSGDYKKAAEIYTSAVEKFGPKPVLCSNLAATLSKLELWSDVEYAATLALKANPRMTKARFRRAMARKALRLYQSALLDLEAIVEHDASCSEARVELEIVEELMDEAMYNEELEEDNLPESLFEDREWPSYHDEPIDYESDSDTEDCRHVGNRTACRFYNHSGCSRRKDCAYSHAPDDKSVRDELGKNVCLRYLVGDCRFGPVNCIYSHDKRYLKPPAWWASPSNAIMSERLTTSVENGIFNVLLPLARSPLSQYIGKRTHMAFINSQLEQAVARARSAKVPAKSTTTAGTSSNPTNSTPFILLISLQDLEWFPSMYAHLVKALSAKRKVITVSNSRDALDKLSWPKLEGVIVTDAGIAERSAASVVVKLIEYVKAGGRAVIGCQFSSFITAPHFKSFFNTFGLSWQQGSYLRTTFYLNPNNQVAAANPSLVKSYSMKALHVDGIISPDMAIYRPTSQSMIQSLVFAPERARNLNESPVVLANIGQGYLGYVGDVNAEEESTDVYLAILQLLDENLTPGDAPLSTAVPVASTSTSANTSSNVGASTSQLVSSAAPSASTFIASSVKMAPGSQTASSSKDATLIIVLLDKKGNTFEKLFSKQITLLQSKSKIEFISTRATLEERLVSSKPIRGIYIADSGILRVGNHVLLPMLANFVKYGGIVVAAGLFPSTINEPDSKQFFSAFGLSWSMGSYNRAMYDLISRAELAKKNPSLPDMFSMKSVNLKNIPLEAAVYMMTPDEDEEEDLLGSESFDGPVLRERVGRGAVGYIGDVNKEEAADSILLAMFGLLDPQIVLVPERDSKPFVLLLSFGQEEFVERAYGSALRKVEEKIEVVRRLSVERMTDLVDSPDLKAVLISSELITSPKYAYLLSRLIEFTTVEGGTVIFLEGFARQITVPECRPFFLDAWGLDWTVGGGHYPEKDVRLNEKNALVVGRQPDALPGKPDLFNAHTLASTNPEELVYAPKKTSTGTTHVGPVMYARVSEKGHVGYLGYVAEEGYVQLLMAMVKL